MSAVLVYRGTCAKCRFLSRLVVILSSGTIRREALGSDMAERLARDHPETRGKLALIDGGRIVYGTRVFLEAPFWILLLALRRVISPGDDRQRRGGS